MRHIPTRSIFYDFETSGLDTCHQLMSFAFVEVDEDLNELSQFSGKVKLAPLVLPDPGAIATTKIDVYKHQAEAEYTETQAMQKINRYILDVIRGHPERNIHRVPMSVNFIGYNSTNFELPHFRTSMIRNGINPYYGKNLIYADLYHLVRMLAATNEEFLDKLLTPDGERPSLSLENIGRKICGFGDAQLHDALEDSRYSIRVAKFLAENYLVHIAEWDAYAARSVGLREKGVVYAHPMNWSKEQQKFVPARYVLIDDNSRYALWVDVDAYYKDAVDPETALRWFNKSTSGLISVGFNNDPEHVALVNDIRKVFSGYTLKNFFEPKQCDIEEHIYNLSFDGLNLLSEVIAGEVSPQMLKGSEKHAIDLYLRYRLRNTDYEETPNVKGLAERYAKYRYSDNGADRLILSDGTPHKTLSEMTTELNALISNTTDPETLSALQSLSKYYESSLVKSLL